MWATGVNVETKLLLLGLAFDHGFGRVKLQADARNERSRGAILRLGATFEGVLRRHKPRADGTWRDSAVYSVIIDEWPAVRAGLEARLAARGDEPVHAVYAERRLTPGTPASARPGSAGQVEHAVDECGGAADVRDRDDRDARRPVADARAQDLAEHEPDHERADHERPRGRFERGSRPAGRAELADERGDADRDEVRLRRRGEATCDQRVATAYTLSAGPPTPAAAFITPEAAPAMSAGVGPDATCEVRVTTRVTVRATMTSTPTPTCSSGADTWVASSAPTTVPASAGTVSQPKRRQSTSRHTRGRISSDESTAHRFTMTTPSNGPSRMTSAGAAMSANPMPVMRCAAAPTSTERATGRSTGTA